MSANPGTLATEDTARLATLGMIVRRRWRLLVALAVLGAIVGALASLLFSPGYQTSTSVLLQGPREPDELLTETQIAMSTVVLERASTELGWNLTGTELQDSVTAEVADGNVIAITATAETAERAQQLADQASGERGRHGTLQRQQPLRQLDQRHGLSDLAEGAQRAAHAVGKRLRRRPPRPGPLLPPHPHLHRSGPLAPALARERRESPSKPPAISVASQPHAAGLRIVVADDNRDAAASLAAPHPIRRALFGADGDVLRRTSGEPPAAVCELAEQVGVAG